MLIHAVIAWGVGVLLAAGLVPALSVWAHRWGVVDKSGHRRVHEKPVPRLGGVAIFLSGYGVILATWLGVFSQISVGAESTLMLVLVVGLPLAFALGLWDDVWGMRSRQKLLLQVLLAGFVCFLGFRVPVVFITDELSLQLGWLSYPLAVLWVVAVMNAVNLIDGIDGLASGVVGITLGMMALLFAILGLMALSLVCVGLLGACLGFWFFNFGEGKIFMGDSGSMSLGFVLAVLSVAVSEQPLHTIPMYLPLLLLAYPLTDMVVSVFRRTIRYLDSEPRRVLSMQTLRAVMDKVMTADGNHIHHCLLRRLGDAKQVSLRLYLLTAIACVCTLLSLLVPSPLAWLLFAGYIFGVSQFVISLSYAEFLPRRERQELGEMVLKRVTNS